MHLIHKKSDFTIYKFKNESPKVKKKKKSKNVMVLRPKKVLYILGYRLSASVCPYTVHMTKTLHCLSDELVSTISGGCQQ